MYMPYYINIALLYIFGNAAYYACTFNEVPDCGYLKIGCSFYYYFQTIT